MKTGTSPITFPFTHFLTFPAVMIHDPDLLRQMIQLFFPDIRIGRLSAEKTFPEYFTPMIDQKSARFDLKMTDDEGRIFIAEMITYKDGKIEVRIQAYIAEENVDSRKHGEPYEGKEVFLLIITANPVNDQKKVLSRYILNDVLNDHKKLKYSPEYLIIHYNGDEDGLSFEQKDFLSYLREGKICSASTSFVKTLNKAVEDINQDEYWRTEIMTLEDIIRFEKEEGIREGMEKGVQKGIEKGSLSIRAQLLKRAMAQGRTVEEAAKVLLLTEEELTEVLNAGLLKD